MRCIAEFTAKTWGDSQARKYIRELEERCAFLAVNPLLGTVVASRRPGIRSMPQGSHIVFYQPELSGIYLIRILHKSMLPGLHQL